MFYRKRTVILVGLAIAASIPLLGGFYMDWQRCKQAKRVAEKALATAGLGRNWQKAEAREFKGMRWYSVSFAAGEDIVASGTYLYDRGGADRLRMRVTQVVNDKVKREDSLQFTVVGESPHLEHRVTKWRHNGSYCGPVIETRGARPRLLIAWHLDGKEVTEAEYRVAVKKDPGLPSPDLATEAGAEAPAKEESEAGVTAGRREGE